MPRGCWSRTQHCNLEATAALFLPFTSFKHFLACVICFTETTPHAVSRIMKSMKDGMRPQRLVCADVTNKHQSNASGAVTPLTQGHMVRTRQTQPPVSQVLRSVMKSLFELEKAQYFELTFKTGFHTWKHNGARCLSMYGHQCSQANSAFATKTLHARNKVAHVELLRGNARPVPRYAVTYSNR